jgi:hypothetical protein
LPGPVVTAARTGGMVVSFGEVIVDYTVGREVTSLVGVFSEKD